jgi:protein phosphatase
MSLRKKLSHVELTDVGRVREHNEDSIGSDPDIGLWVLADGMGGYNAGEVASGIARAPMPAPRCPPLRGPPRRCGISR